MRGGGILACLLVLVPLGAASCSFPLRSADDSTLHEVVFGYHAVQPEAGRTRRVAAGVDLRTSASLGGITLGLDDARILELPEDATRAAPCDEGFVWPLGVRWRSDRGECRSLGWFAHSQPMPGRRLPSFVHQLGAGALIEWNDASQGVSLGFGSATVLRADPDACGVFILDYRSRAPAQGWIREWEKERRCD